MANKNIGRITCPFCGETAAVRRYGRGSEALYFYCANDGIIRPSLPHGQQWIAERAEFYEDEKPAEAAPSPRNEETSEASSTPRRNGLFGGINL